MVRLASTVLAVVVALATASVASAQERTAKNTIHGELGGAAMGLSLNYERLVISDLGVRAGFGFWYSSASASAGGATASASSTTLFFPITASYLGISTGSHALEVGGGGTIIHTSGSASSLGMEASGSGMTIIGTGIVGYRVQPRDGGFNFRVGFSPLFGKGLSFSDPDPEKIQMLPWFHLSFGGTF